MPMLCEMLGGPASGMAVELKKTSDDFENQSFPPCPLGGAQCSVLIVTIISRPPSV